jgi:hypothetical protein
MEAYDTFGRAAETKALKVASHADDRRPGIHRAQDPQDDADDQ